MECVLRKHATARLGVTREIDARHPGRALREQIALDVATDLHLLVLPLGFDLDHRKVKRAGLDYWPAVRLSVHPSFEALARRLCREHLYVFSTHAETSYATIRYPQGAVLLFGSETAGLPDTIRSRFEDRLVRIPVLDAVRSLNLSNAVAVAAYEAVRQLNSLP